MLYIQRFTKKYKFRKRNDLIPAMLIADDIKNDSNNKLDKEL